MYDDYGRKTEVPPTSTDGPCEGRLQPGVMEATPHLQPGIRANVSDGFGQTFAPRSLDALPLRHPLCHQMNASVAVATKPSHRTGPVAKTTVALKNMKAKNV
jgi:hypothetical protein